MNSGVCVLGSCYNDIEKDYYGMLEEIIELEYMGAQNKVVLFKCHWYETEKGVKVHPRHGFVEVNKTSRHPTDDVFVLAEQANQVYYANYPSKKKTLHDWWVASKVKPSGAPEIPTIELNDIAFQEDAILIQVDIAYGNVDDEPINLVDGAIVEEIDPSELRHEESPTLLDEEEEEEEDEEVESEEKDSNEDDSEEPEFEDSNSDEHD